MIDAHIDHGGSDPRHSMEEESYTVLRLEWHGI